MIGAVIYYGKNTLVAELPMGTLDLQMKLSSIGVGEPADRIPLKDDEERQLQVKLYASSPEEAHLPHAYERLQRVQPALVVLAVSRPDSRLLDHLWP